MTWTRFSEPARSSTRRLFNANRWSATRVIVFVVIEGLPFWYTSTYLFTMHTIALCKPPTLNGIPRAQNIYARISNFDNGYTASGHQARIWHHDISMVRSQVDKSPRKSPQKSPAKGRKSVPHRRSTQSTEVIHKNVRNQSKTEGGSTRSELMYIPGCFIGCYDIDKSLLLNEGRFHDKVVFSMLHCHFLLYTLIL